VVRFSFLVNASIQPNHASMSDCWEKVGADHVAGTEGERRYDQRDDDKNLINSNRVQKVWIEDFHLFHADGRVERLDDVNFHLVKCP
jgi:hypothetical protein